MEEKNLLDIQPEAQETDAPTECSLGTPEEYSKNEQEAFRVFKTQEEFQQCLDRALGRRLSKARQQDEELQRLKPIIAAALKRFEVSSVEELEAEMQKDKSAQAAEDAETETGEPLEIKAQLADALNKELLNLTQNASSFYGMQTVDGLLENEQFLSLVKDGFSIKDAFDACFLPELLKSEEQRVRAEVIREIRIRGLRPEEDALSGYGSFSAALDPKNLSDEQRAQIRERVRRGERVTF